MITFREAGEIASATVAHESFGEFNITYEVPSAAALFDEEVDGVKGARMQVFIAKYLRSWTLSATLPEKEEGRIKVISSMRPPEAMALIYAEMRGAGQEQRKN
jgi:hypothetical protein